LLRLANWREQRQRESEDNLSPVVQRLRNIKAKRSSEQAVLA